MAVSVAPRNVASSDSPRPLECRVWERFPCDVPASCQPVAARSDGDLHWQATLKDLSASGAGVVLGRRFEAGAALAIELPATATRPADTLLARVVQVRALAGGRWLLGCAFVSQLSSDEVENIVGMAKVAETPGSTQASATLKNQVLAQVVFYWHDCIPGARPFMARRLFLTGSWPLAPGAVLRVRRGNTPGQGAWLRVRIQSCVEDHGQWNVTCAVLGQPNPGVLRSLGIPTDH
jgi:hypothetical protein